MPSYGFEYSSSISFPSDKFFFYMVHSHSDNIILHGIRFGVKLPWNVEILPITEKDEELFAS